jgi:hypothetical protein
MNRNPFFYFTRSSWSLIRRKEILLFSFFRHPSQVYPEQEPALSSLSKGRRAEPLGGVEEFFSVAMF